MNFKEYVIREGRHRSGIYFQPHFNCTFLHNQVLFERDCQYDLGTEDQQDINKLFGVSYGLHHNNSARFGWRSVNDQIEIFAYCYINKKRVYQSMGLIDMNTLYNFKLHITEDQYLFKIYHVDKLVATCVIAKTKTTEFGYYLFPYFGGNRRAPHKMHIQFRKLRTKCLKVFYEQV